VCVCVCVCVCSGVILLWGFIFTAVCKHSALMFLIRLESNRGLKQAQARHTPAEAWSYTLWGRRSQHG